MSEYTFPDVTCTGARLRCENLGHDYVSCLPHPTSDPMSQVMVTCRKPELEERATKLILSGLIGATVTGGLAYSFGRQDPLKAAALGGALGLLLGGYV